MEGQTPEKLVTLSPDEPIWDRFYAVAPLVLIGTKEPDGSYDLAPKHMATPLGWGPYFGFVCTPDHRTYHNARREEVFTVSYPRPSQVLATSLAAAPRCDDYTKPSLEALDTFSAAEVDGVFVADAYLYLECRLHGVWDGFDAASLVAGRVTAAHVAESALRMVERDDADLIDESPLLAYLSPGRYARIRESFAFPFSENLDE